MIDNLTRTRYTYIHKHLQYKKRPQIKKKLNEKEEDKYNFHLCSRRKTSKKKFDSKKNLQKNIREPRRRAGYC